MKNMEELLNELINGEGFVVVEHIDDESEMEISFIGNGLYQIYGWGYNDKYPISTIINILEDNKESIYWG